MVNFKSNDKLHEQVQGIVLDIHKQLQDAGIKLKLSKLSFEPMSGEQDCPCGYEFIIDPKTHKVIGTRCKRCQRT